MKQINFLKVLMFMAIILWPTTTQAQTYSGGDGSADSPYEIKTTADLQALADSVKTTTDYSKGKFFKLTADIDLKSICYKVNGTSENDKSWTPIGNSLKPFQGSFDGDGHTISNLYINPNFYLSSSNYQGLFGCIGENGTIKNLNLVNSIVSGRSYVGSVAGNNYGIISYCTNSGSVKGHGLVGGVAGDNSGTILNCTNSGSVIASGDVGGIAGGNNDTISYCTNSGEVRGDYRVGGVAGENYGIISYCINNSNISGKNYSANVAGGIVGDNEKGTVSYSTNNGKVSGDEKIGGVVGNNYYNSTILNCTNNGSIKGFTSVGGVVGQNEELTTISYSTNNGNISGTYHVGGVAGFNTNNCDISYSINSGNVSGYDKTGGVVGANHYLSAISNCINTGTISGGSYVGGVAGYNTSSPFSYSTNSGSVSGRNYVGGVTGYNAYNGIFSYCTNSGSVSGDQDAGNVAGDNIGTISYSYYDKQMCTLQQAVGNDDTLLNDAAKLTSEMTGIELKTSDTGDGFTKEHWVFTEGLYPIPKGLENSDAAIVAATPIFLSNEENYSSVTTDFKVSTDNDVVWTAEPQTSVTIKNDGSFKLIKQGEVTLYAEKNGVIYKSVILNPIKTNGFEIVKQNFVVPYLRSTTEGINVDFGKKSQTLIIYSQDGKQKLKKTSIGKTYIDMSSFETGIYIFKINNQIFRIVKR